VDKDSSLSLLKTRFPLLTLHFVYFVEGNYVMAGQTGVEIQQKSGKYNQSSANVLPIRFHNTPSQTNHK
jgi:hypothetical protein